MKVMTILGTRPDIIKLSRIIPTLDRSFEHILVHTGQNYDYELNEIFFEDLGLRKPDYFLNSAKSSAIETIASVLVETESLISKISPDAILIYGDTNSALSVISAKRKKIPIFHMEAGNRCFDQRVPEEINRKIVDHLSDVNMVHSEHARRYLLNEGLNPQMIVKSGSPMPEVLSFYKEKIASSQVLFSLGLESKDYFVVSIHREENVDYEGNFSNLLKTLETLAQTYNKKIIVSTHPRTKKRLDESNFKASGLISFMKPLGFTDYIALQKNALCTLSDSGTITEEASILNFPAVTVRQAHERPEGSDVGAVILTGTKPEMILDAVRISIEQFSSPNFKLKVISDYEQQEVSAFVVRTILSYVDLINRTVWKR
jgi:UDP-N-acetylglucosamine 2-epimerase (non-hydrolysing)